jgi:6-phosphogluconolactonase
LIESAEVFVHIYADPPAVCRGAAPIVASLARSTAKSKGRFSVALAGGNTPKQLYRVLASDVGFRLPWEQIHLFWGDERFVPVDDPLSNYRMVKEELLDSIRIPASNIHMISTDFADSDAAALSYEQHLCSFFGSAVPSFDLILLGMGSDGHVASLFPGTPALAEKEKRVIAVRVEAIPPVRISLTLPVINAANRIMVLVTGKKKNAAVQQALGYGKSGNSILPGALLRPAGELHWMLDREAAGKAGPRMRCISKTVRE